MDSTPRSVAAVAVVWLLASCAARQEMPPADPPATVADRLFLEAILGWLARL